MENHSHNINFETLATPCKWESRYNIKHIYRMWLSNAMPPDTRFSSKPCFKETEVIY